MGDSPQLGPAWLQPAFDWPRLLRARTPVEALEELGRSLGSWVSDFALISTNPSEGSIAAWHAAPGAPVPGSPTRRIVDVPGEPGWQLSAGLLDAGLPAIGAVDRAALLLQAWRVARTELARAEARLEARTNELDVLQALGRAAAEARRPPDLFRSAVAVLQAGADIDLAVAAYTLDGTRELLVILSRPAREECIDDVTGRVTAFMGWLEADGARVQRMELEGFDAARGTRREFNEQDLVLLPLVRRGRPVGCLTLLAVSPVDEARTRLLYGASNQLSLHFDRIVTVAEAEADRFRSIVDSMPQGVLLVDDRLRLIHANESARRLARSSGVDLFADLAPTLDRLGLSGLVDDVRSRRKSFSEGESHIEGDRVWSVTVSPLEDERRRVSGLVLVLADVTERRRMQQRLAQSEKLSSLGGMISGVAHELNNPLASVVGYAQLLGAAPDEEKLAARLGILCREADRCRRIVHNLLSFARGHEPERRPISLNQVVNNVLALMGYQLKVDGIRIETDLAQDLPAFEADAHQLEQVLVNLLTNARHGIRERGDRGLVVLRTETHGADAIELQVQDNGIGVPQDVRSKIFDPFFTTKERGQGTGLGLSLVYGTMTAHGGTVEFSPAPGGGARFTLIFPLGPSRPATREVKQEALNSPAVHPARILVVDDEASLGTLICEVLSADGHRPVHVADGDDALARVATEEFDLVISDLKMPGMSGERLYGELSRAGSGLAARLIFTSGDTFSKLPEALAAHSGGELLTKPFDVEELRLRVRRMLARCGGR